jgi:hypothetical protein
VGLLKRRAPAVDRLGMRDGDNPSICITCGEEASETRLNRLEDGRVCPACRDRLLHQLAPLLPGLGRERIESAEQEATIAELPVPVRRPKRSRGPRKPADRGEDEPA